MVLTYGWGAGPERALMKTTVKLGRVAGVAVGVHWSVLAIVVLLVAGLTAQLPDIAPGYPAAAYVSAAVLAALLFVASLLGHELAHAVVARRNGVAVDGITLWLLGGVARLRGEAPTPGRTSGSRRWVRRAAC